MPNKKEGNQYDQIPEGPRSDLGKYLYDQFLRRIIPGVLKTSVAVTEYASSQSPRTARRMKASVTRLSAISAQAAEGRLQDVNFPLLPFGSMDAAEDFAQIVSLPDSELLPVPSSVTHRLHNPHEIALDGIARDSKIPGLSTIVTEVTALRLGSNKKYYTVKLVGRNRLRENRP